MSITVYANQNDTLDQVIYRQFGKTQGLTEQVLQLNPCLANTPYLKIGQAIKLPALDKPVPTIKKIVQLWD